MPTARKSVIEEKWDDSWTFNIGVSYDYSPEWTFRAGYQYDQTPVQSAEYRTPRIPDSDRNSFAVGFSYRPNPQLSVDFGYMYLLFDDSSTRNTIDLLPPPVPSGLVTDTLLLDYNSYGQSGRRAGELQVLSLKKSAISQIEKAGARSPALFLSAHNGRNGGLAACFDSLTRGLHNMSNAASIRRVAVLGAGVMGAQIAAHLANADVPVVLFDLPAKDGDPNGIVTKAIANMVKLSPAPFAVKERAELIQPANYDQHLEALRSCDLLIEAIAERPDWKADLYKRITPYLNERAILATNTSGLPLSLLAESVPENVRARFCGIHFFNPPRYMALVELIPCQTTDPTILDQLETFLVSTLGKGVVRAKDTPNFIANRIGVFSMAATIHHTHTFGLGLDLVDALTGPAIGRPKSATYRTADIVGLDTMGHVFKGSALALRDDPWRQYYNPPAWLTALIDKGALGQKTGAGIYASKGKQVLDLGDWRISGRRRQAGRSGAGAPEN